MSVSILTNNVVANGNGVARTFSFSDVVIGKSSDLVVTHRDAAGQETLLVEGSSSVTYSVSVSAYPGTGSIDYPASGGTLLATGESLSMKSVRGITQGVDLQNQGGYFADTQETAFDKLTYICQQQQEEIDRSVKIPVTDVGTTLATLQANIITLGAISGDLSALVAALTGATETVAGTVERATQTEANAGGDTIRYLSSANIKSLFTTPFPYGAVTPNTGKFTSLQLAAGSVPTEFSTDGTLAGNSDTAIPTEKAVKTYADALPDVPAASAAEQEAGTEAAKYVAPATQHRHVSAAKAWVKFTMADDVIDSSYNITSLANIATGRTTINWATDFSTINYVPMGTVLQTSARIINLNTIAVGSIEVLTYDSAAAATDSLLSVIALGDQ